MKTKIFTLIGVAIIPVLAGCASQPMAISPVGPASIGFNQAASRGYLRVFSATKTHAIAEDTYYYPHTGYSIHDESGKMIKFVSNHVGSVDESPAFVALPSGKYNIVAQSESYGRVTVPVVVANGKTTVVHLDRDWRVADRLNASSAAENLVRLPDGEPIGWKLN